MKKIALDIAIVLSCITGIILSYVYLENLIEKQISLGILSIEALED